MGVTLSCGLASMPLLTPFFFPLYQALPFVIQPHQLAEVLMEQITALYHRPFVSKIGLHAHRPPCDTSLEASAMALVSGAVWRGLFIHAVFQILFALVTVAVVAAAVS